MRSYFVTAGSTSLEGLVMRELDTLWPGQGEVLVRVRACSKAPRKMGIHGSDKVVETGGAGKMPQSLHAVGPSARSRSSAS